MDSNGRRGKQAAVQPADIGHAQKAVLLHTGDHHANLIKVCLQHEVRSVGLTLIDGAEHAAQGGKFGLAQRPQQFYCCLCGTVLAAGNAHGLSELLRHSLNGLVVCHGTNSFLL